MIRSKQEYIEKYGVEKFNEILNKQQICEFLSLSGEELICFVNTNTLPECQNYETEMKELTDIYNKKVIRCAEILTQLACDEQIPVDELAEKYGMDFEIEMEESE